MADADAPASEGEGDELRRVRLENETLSDIVSIVSFSADLELVLDRIVDLLTRATRCHACFVYLTVGHELRLRAASPVYRHLVGKIGFSVDEGLAGWAVSNNQAAFIRDNASADPRTNDVPELEEERFQSMVAVPIPSRAGTVIGAVVLHTAAPREFDEGILNVLGRAASLVAGAIENAQLYEDARLRVDALTRLSTVAQQIAAVMRRAELYDVATSGIRTLLPCDVCRLYEFDDREQLQLVASDPPSPTAGMESNSATDALFALLTPAADRPQPARAALAAALNLPDPPGAAIAVPLMAGSLRLGMVVAAAHEPWAEPGTEVLRAAAHQIAVSLQRATLIERLTEENAARDLFDALADGKSELAAELAKTAAIDLAQPHILIEARPLGEIVPGAWPELAERIEASLRRTSPGGVLAIGRDGLRAVLPVAADAGGSDRPMVGALETLATEHGLIIGVSETRRGAAAASESLRDAADSVRIAYALHDEPTVLAYRDTGAYRYLIAFIDEPGPHDHLRAAVERLVEYDKRRRSQLLATLDLYLAGGRAPARTARELTIHVNTLRQRLERIEAISGLRLATEDLLALQLAIKLARVRRPSARHDPR